MASPIMLRKDFDARRLRGLAKASRDPDQHRRLLSLAEIYIWRSRGDGARIGDVGLQMVRDWVIHFACPHTVPLRWGFSLYGRTGMTSNPTPKRPAAVSGLTSS